MNQDINLSRDQRAAALSRLTSAMRAAQVARDQADEAVADFLGVNRTDLRCLQVIDQHDDVTAGLLAEAAGLTTGAVTSVLDRLETAGYVRRVRDERDRRKVFVMLTGQLNRLVEEIYGPLKAAVQPLNDLLTDHQIVLLTQFMETNRRLNLEHATLIRSRVSPPKASTKDRVERAQKLKADGKGLVSWAKADVRRWKEAIREMCETQWVEDADGHWVNESGQRWAYDAMGRRIDSSHG